MSMLSMFFKGLPKMPADAMILFVPVAYSCAAMGYLTWRTLRYDPEMSSGLEYYEEKNKEAVAQTSKTYRFGFLNYFRNSIKDHESWSVPIWSNEAKPLAHPHS